MSKTKTASPAVLYFFSCGGIVQECGIPHGRRARTIGTPTYRALCSDAEWKNWAARNPGITTWKTVDGARVDA